MLGFKKEKNYKVKIICSNCILSHENYEFTVKLKKETLIKGQKVTCPNCGNTDKIRKGKNGYGVISLYIN